MVLVLFTGLAVAADPPAVIPAVSATAAPAAPAAPVARPLAIAPVTLLAPVKTDSPRDTLRSLLNAMDHVRSASLAGDDTGRWLEDAQRTLDLGDLQPIERSRVAFQAAIHLKEVIDRVIVIDDALVPGSDVAGPNLPRWRLRHTEIVIHRMESGERAGEYLFTPDTVARADVFYRRVRHLPYLSADGGSGMTATWAQRHLPAWTTIEVLGLASWQWLVLTGALILSLLIRRIMAGIESVAMKLTRHTETEWDDLLVGHLSAPIALLAVAGIWYVSIGLLGLDGGLLNVVTILIKGTFFAAIAFAAYRLMTVVWVFVEHQSGLATRIGPQLTRLLGQVVRAFALLIVGIAAAQNLGLDVASLIAGLGIGGLAVALAAQDTLSNLFASVMIMIDRPFAVGHFINTPGGQGAVEEIGLRTTRLRTPAGSVISIPNGELVKATIDNLGMRPWRRINETFRIEYATPPERIEALLAGIKVLIAATPLTRKDEFFVVVDRFADPGIDLRVIFYITTDSWAEELATKEHVLLGILSLARRLDIRFAVPPLPALSGMPP